LKKTRLKP